MDLSSLTWWRPRPPAVLERPVHGSVDEHPWNHPFVTVANIERFRRYSDSVLDFALAHAKKRPRPLTIAFTDNIAQNMHNWARLASRYGARSTLFPNPLDFSVLSCPEWEEFDGEHAALADGPAFLRSYPGIRLEVPVRRIPMDDEGLLEAWHLFKRGNRKELRRIRSRSRGVKLEALIEYEGFYPYFRWARELSAFDVIYATNTPFAAYASGKPYCLFSMGGDLQFAAGRSDDVGALINLSFRDGRFLMITNPHTLGHCRRLRFLNGVHLPYPVDTTRYSPGSGKARQEWESRFGPGVYVLSTARLDARVKGQSTAFFEALVGVLRSRPKLRLIFLAWGQNAADLRKLIATAPLHNRLILLEPVGKARLIDYYRSCDAVLDQMVYGYFGATALEAAAVGKPIVMRARNEQYRALYAGDAPPVINVNGVEEISSALVDLVDNISGAKDSGNSMRQWLVRNHGEERTMPRLLALLRLAADRVSLPRDLISPLNDPESDAERDYHNNCCKEQLRPT